MATTTKTTKPPPSSQKTAPAKKAPVRQQTPLFDKGNYRWMLIGLAIVALGIILMVGGKSKDPNVFDPHQVYSFARITLAPILILGGFAVEIYAIFRKDKAEKA